MNDSIDKQDLFHLYNNLIKAMNIESIFWLGSFDSIFFGLLMQFSNIIFITSIDINQNNSRIKTFNNDIIKYIYIDNQKYMNEAIENLNRPIIFTPIYYKHNSYVSLSISSNLFCMISGILDIEYLPKVGKEYNFNSSVICYKDNKYKYIYTGDEEIIFSVRSSDTKFIQSDLELISTKRCVSIKCDNICREDVRLFNWKDELYGSYTFIYPYTPGIKTFNRLVVGKFKDLNIVEEYIPIYGGNLTDSAEKNWTWWESPSGNLHCVYMFTPLKVLEFTDFNKPPTDITIPYNIPNTVRGGACGVVYDGKVWCFTHTLINNGGGCNVGVVVLSHTEKPEVIGYCNELISSKDYKGIFFYICGAFFDSEALSWKLTGGVQDSRSCIITISHSDVCKSIGL